MLRAPWPRLDALWRVLIMLVPFTAGVMLIAGRIVIPALWNHPLSAGIMARPCLFRVRSGIPCPLCGGTRSVVLAASGEWHEALLMNPLAAVLMAGLIMSAIWCVICAATGLDLGVTTIVARLRRRYSWYAVIAAVLVLWLAKLMAT